MAQLPAVKRSAVGLLVLRLAMGMIFFLHGWMKLVGGLALILGVFARAAALVLAVEMIVVVVLFHARQGFFIVAVPNVPLAYGFEFHVALIGGLLCTALAGPGALTISNRLKRQACE